MMAKAKGTRQTRLQVPVPAWLADELEQLAKKLDKSQSWAVVAILEGAVEDRSSVGGWLASRMAKLGLVPFDVVGKAIKARKRKATKGVVYFDVRVDDVTADFVRSMAQGLGHSEGKMAGQLVEWGWADDEWIWNLLVAPAHKAIKSLPRPKRSVRKKAAGDGMEPGPA